MPYDIWKGPRWGLGEEGIFQFFWGLLSSSTYKQAPLQLTHDMTYGLLPAVDKTSVLLLGLVSG